MARKEQCEQCDRYIQERGLCRRNWNLPEFNETECESFKGDEPTKTVVEDVETIKEPLDNATSNIDSQFEQPTEQRQRHGCATAWLLSMLVICSFCFFIFLFFSFWGNPNEEQLYEYIGYMINVGIIFVSVILLFRWNIWGLYIIFGLAIIHFLYAIFIEGRISAGIGLLAAMTVAFNMQAKDGFTFFEHLGFTNRKNRMQRNVQSFYINRSNR